LPEAVEARRYLILDGECTNEITKERTKEKIKVMVTCPQELLLPSPPRPPAPSRGYEAEHEEEKRFLTDIEISVRSGYGGKSDHI